ncbi:methyltransferase [Theileria orientalis]|uniref:Methyltransferase n=1 Tax=Theileria orientalis TaxID=68886 RepID=A0A976M9B6_THEOR|nr:methyltransferase [Theileria orientalis]
MVDKTEDVEIKLTNQDKKSTKNTRLGWKSRCREMQAVRWGKKAKSVSENDNERGRFVEGTPSNEEFEAYYKHQRICKEEEWDVFMEYSKKLLPVSFRLNTSAFLWKSAREKLIRMCDTEELELKPCVDYRLDYLKNEENYNVFYQMKADRGSLRKNEKFTKFHQFLMNEDNRGSLSRQETVSMLPVLFLDPKPNENILDICAAPGMKYLQIVDMVESRLKWNKMDSLENKGIIIGNDVSQSRVSTLAHHLKTINSPSTAVTNYDATRFPNMYNKNGKQILFDKILADMPCSCDGTMRKSMDIWTNWKATNGLHLHKVQLAILKRGIELLKPGGELIYSTCSLNPLENEAVANYCESSDEVELVDLEPIKGFQFETGLLDWKVPDLKGGYYSEFAEVDGSLRERIKETMFKNSDWNEEIAKKVMRVLPHYNNTGGFFIFKIRKKGKVDLCKDEPETNNHIVIEEEYDERKIERKKSRGAKLLHEYTPFRGAEHDEIMEYYGIEKELNFVVKYSSDKSVYLVSDSDWIRPYKRNKINKYEQCKYASLGTRVFTRLETKEESQTQFRITQEGSEVLHRYVSKRKLISNMGFLKALLNGTVTYEEIRNHENRGNVVLKGLKDVDGIMVNGPLLIVSILEDKEVGHEVNYESLEYITLAAVAINTKLHLYVKEETLRSLKILL